MDTISYKLISTISVCLLIIGLYFRFNRRVHIPLMGTAAFIDLILVVVLETQRSVMNQVVRDELSGSLQMHLPFAITTGIMYVPLIIFGIRLAKGAEQIRVWHRYTGGIFIVVRLGNYITSLML